MKRYDDENEVIFKDRIDRQCWQSLLELSSSLQQKVNNSPLYQDFLGDIHSALFKSAPVVKPIGKITPSRIPSRAIIEEMLKTSDYRQLHAFTVGDSLGSGLGTMALADKLLAELQKFPAQNEKDIRELKQLAENLKDSTYQEKISELAEESKNTIRVATRKACREAQEDVQQAIEGIASWGTEPGKPVSIDIAKSLEVARQLMTNPKLQSIAALAGRMRSIALSKRATKSDTTPEEIVDVEMGNDLARVLPSELLAINNPLFLQKYVEGNLMQRKMEGREKLGKGPIAFCMDESGSMYGDKEIWAKAYFLGLQALAAKDKRDIAYITFGTSVSRCEIFPKGIIDPSHLSDMLANFTGHSGTAFDPPLNEALKITKKDLPKADIIFATDGASYISEFVKAKVKKAKKNQGLHLYVVLIGEGSGKVFEDIADEIVRITPQEDNPALDIYQLL